MTHELKILPEYFEEVAYGSKRFELRRFDRDYKIGDIVWLEEFDGENYTGKKIAVEIKYILSDCEIYGLKDGFCIFGFEIVTPKKPIVWIDEKGNITPIVDEDSVRADERKRIAEHLRSFVCRENCGERRCVDKMDECVWVGYIDEFFGEYEKECEE